MPARRYCFGNCILDKWLPEEFEEDPGGYERKATNTSSIDPWFILSCL
jgi:hypothetical protein